MINQVISPVQNIGAATLNSLAKIGRACLFLGQVAGGFPGLIWRPYLLVQQLFSVGVLSLIIILMSGLFVGMVLGLQGYNILTTFGAENSLGIMVALTLVRELGPVLTAILFAGRAGSALTAEIGLMKATEQLSAMEMMAVNPLHRVIAPRLAAGIIAVPLLAAMFSAIGFIGGHLVVVSLLGVDAGSYWGINHAVDFMDDVFNGIIKSVVFGVAVTWIAVFEGYDTVPTSAGVSRSTTRTVVNSAMATLTLDFVLTAVMFN